MTAGGQAAGGGRREEVALAALVEDFSIYPRHAVDGRHVAALVYALRAGGTLPPVVIERGTKRIVDGWHRARAHRQVLGPEGVVDVESMEYETEAALLLDSIGRNAAHGRRFDSIDLVRAIHMGAERGIPLARVAGVLHLPLEKAERLSAGGSRHEKGGRVMRQTSDPLNKWPCFVFKRLPLIGTGRLAFQPCALYRLVSPESEAGDAAPAWTEVHVNDFASEAMAQAYVEGFRDAWIRKGAAS